MALETFVSRFANLLLNGTSISQLLTRLNQLQSVFALVMASLFPARHFGTVLPRKSGVN